MLGIKLKKSGPQLRGQCPICKDNSDRAFVITPAKGLYYCFGKCGKGGDAICSRRAAVHPTSDCDVARRRRNLGSSVRGHAIARMARSAGRALAWPHGARQSTRMGCSSGFSGRARPSAHAEKLREKPPPGSACDGGSSGNNLAHVA